MNVGGVLPQHNGRWAPAQQVVRLHMNKLQREMVVNWCASGAVLLAMLVLEAVGLDRWMQPLLVTVAVIALVTRRPRPMAPSTSWATALAKHPWVRWWMVA